MNFTNSMNLPKAFFNAVSAMDNRVRSYDLSVTELIGPPRIFYLKQRHNAEITVDVKDRLWALRGSALHDLLAKHCPAEQIAEERVRRDICGYVVSGMPDLFDEHTIQDWKDTSVWAVVKQPDKKEHLYQLNAYRYLLMVAGFTEITKLENVYILRDWLKSKATEENYPKENMLIVQRDVMKTEDIEEYMQGRVKSFQSCKDLADDMLPICTPEERWHTDDTWALKKEGRKTAIKVCTSELEARQLVSDKYKGGDHFEFRCGSDKRCTGFCEVSKFCLHAKALAMVKVEAEEE